MNAASNDYNAQVHIKLNSVKPKCLVLYSHTLIMQVPTNCISFKKNGDICYFHHGFMEQIGLVNYLLRVAYWSCDL